MRRLFLAPLIFALSAPVLAEKIPQISDYDGTFSSPYKLNFDCPTKKQRVMEDGKLENKTVKIYDYCWVDFYDNYMEIMGRQKIKKENILRYWFKTEILARAFRSEMYTFHFIYLDDNGNKAKFIAKRKVNDNVDKLLKSKNHMKYMNYIPKNHKFMAWIKDHNAINAWLAN